MKEIFQEIYYAMKSNKLRTFLTGFAISWGIFMLIVLLGVGSGLQKGIIESMNYMNKNTANLSSSWTSKSYKGLSKWREIKFQDTDSVFFNSSLHPGIDQVILSNRQWGKTLATPKNHMDGSIEGVGIDYGKIKSIDILQGRFVNELDMLHKRKVVVLNKDVANSLFGPDPNVIGKTVTIDDLSFTVVGIYSEAYDGRWSSTFIPFETFKALYSPEGQVSSFNLVLDGIDSEEESEAMETALREKASRIYHFDPTDRRGVWIRNTLKRHLQNLSISKGINFMIWIIGLGTLISGVVGVGNIMLISVKERTREFGIRKALGAKPRGILMLVLMEAICITTLFGYIGILLGVGLTEGVTTLLSKSSGGGGRGGGMPIKDLGVDLEIVFLATLVLIVSGIIAGFIPAKKAVSIKPIDAMRG